MAESASSQNFPSTSRQSLDEICLETHTWHVQHDFHITHKWNLKIPYFSLKKNRTASYRAITENCLLQDISYYTCIEIVGEKNWLEATLKEHCEPKETFTAEMYTNGQKEGMVMFFRKNGYPQFPIGNVNFFWKLSETNIKTIWIWVHPAFYSDFLSEIISSFEFKQNNARQGRTDMSHNLNDLYTNDAGCEMHVLKYALNRFRLSGPAALSVLKEALHILSYTITEQDLENYPMIEEQDPLRDEKLDTSSDSNVSVQPVEEMEIDEKATKDLTTQDLREKMWHTKYYQKKENIEACKIQEQMWQSMKVLKSPSLLPSNMIIGLTVLDPRFYLPATKITPESPLSAENLHSQLPTDLSRSPIWDAQIRQIVSSSCVSTHTIDKIVMSVDPDFNETALAKIPILLIQKPAVASLGLGSRIDIIIPSGWAMAFWMALLTQSPLVGGLQETELIILESLGTNVPDINDPDTPADMREALTKKKQFTNEYFSYSLKRRIDFIKFGIRSPFFCDWKNLTKGWSDVENFYVLRDYRLLALLKNEIKTNKNRNTMSESTVQESEFDFQDFDEYQNCLVQVKLSLVDKRKPNEFAIICMPKREDLRRLEIKYNYEGPVEECHSDPNEEARKALNKSHSVELEQISRQLFRSEVKRKETSQDKVLIKKFLGIRDVTNDALLSKRDKMVSDHEKEMRKLYLPESTEVRHSCDREVMGYVTMGDYSFLRAKAIGIGYVTLPSLLQFICEKLNIVLVRNNTELQYKFARLKILVDKCAS